MNTAALDLGAPLDPAPGRLRRVWLALRERLGVVLALFVLALLLAAALAPEPLAPLIWIRPGRRSSFFWLTPYLLSDPATVRFWTAMLHAAAPTLAVGLAAALGATIIGAGVGALAGARGLALVGVPLRAGLALVEAFPPLLLALVAMVVLGTRDIALGGWIVPQPARLACVVALLLAPRVAQVVRDAMVRARAEPHLAAERALGASALRIELRSVMRRALRPLAACAAPLVGAAILMETTISFLGLGMPAATPSWGALLAAGMRPMLAGQWRMVVVPGALLLVTVAALNYLAHALRERLGVRSAA